MKRHAIREAAGRYRVTNPRVFGSALHGTDKDDSALGLWVDVLPDTTLFDLGGLQIAHGYFDIDVTVVLNTVQQHLQPLLKAPPARNA